jgi:hypothetical protein
VPALYVFAMATGAQPHRHTPLPLGTPPCDAIFPVARAAYDGRLVLYAGAGLSMASPACGPRGPQVANRLRPFVAEVIRVPVTEVDEPDLESLAARVERDAPQRMADLKARAAEAADFRAMEPNYGHEIVALLLREGALQAISVNWDRGVENAGRRLNIQIEGVADARDRLRLGQELPLFKVHGCATRPATLALTRAEVDRPQGWAQAEVARALAGVMVVFLGLGTVGLYVSEPIAELVDLWRQEGVTIRVVDPCGLSPAWRDALGEDAEGVEIALGADAFLDDLLRAIVGEALSLTENAVRQLDDGSPWVATMLTGCQAIRDALASSPADAVLRWWRDGVTATMDGRAFIFDHAGRQSLMALALLAGVDGGALTVAGTEDHLTVRSDRRYFEIVCRPGEKFVDIERIARERVRRRHAGGRYDPGIPMVVAVHGGVGTFPDASAHPDIGAENDPEGDLAAETGGDVRLIRAELAVTGELVA